MGFLTDKEIEDRVSSPDNLVNRLEIHSMRNMPKGTTDIPMEIRKVAAILGTEGETCRDLEKGLGISRNSINQYENGLTTGRVVPELKRVIDEKKVQLQQNRETAESLAVDALLSHLKILPDHIGNKKSKTISSVAKDMAAISNMMGNGRDPSGTNSAGMHLHLYAPKIKTLEDYDIIDITS